MTTGKFIPRSSRAQAGPWSLAASPSEQDRLEIVINETVPAAQERMPDTLRRIDRGEASGFPHALSMPWNDLVWLLTGDRLTLLRRLRSDPTRVSGTEQTATLEWAGLVRVDAEGRPSVPYREIVIRIQL